MRVLPKVGDLIRTNYSSGGIVKRVHEEGGIYYFVYHNPPRSEESYLNDFVLVDGRCRRRYAWSPESSGYSSNRGGRDGDGYDEIFIVEAVSVQRGQSFDLFAELEEA